jgi:CRISPR/Cas system-associated endonuclease Cas1
VWRIVVIESNAKLSYKLGYLIVRNTEEKRVHLDEISTLIVESNQCVITTNLINECAIRNINLIFCDAKHLPSVNCIGINGNTSASKRLMNQIN